MNSFIRKGFKRPKILFGITCILFLYGAGLLAPFIAPYDYATQDILAAREGPSMAHLLGTDWLGRDILSRIIFSLRTNLIISFATVSTGSLILGVALGITSGYFAGKIDGLIMRIGEVFMAFPSLLLVILIAATVRPRVLDWVRGIEDAWNVTGVVRSGLVDYLVIFGALAAFSWVGMARLVRGQVLFLKEMPYIVAIRSTGASELRIMFRHLLPNAMPPIVVMATMGMGTVVGAEVVLSWLGIGVQPPVPSLGSMIRDGQDISVLRNHPQIILAPVTIVAILIFSWNLLGDGVNDLLNPRAW